MIAACLICKNSKATIERTIDSIRPFVDEINVYDTGSTDGTVKLLKTLAKKKSLGFLKENGTPVEDWNGFLDVEAHNALAGEDSLTYAVPLAPIKVEKGEWRNDFSWAREQSFAMASDEVDWFFWLDDDDVIVGAQNLRALAARAHPSLHGYIVFYNYAQDASGNCVCTLWRERLIRRDERWGWRNAVHEVWLPKEGSGIHPNYMQIPPEELAFIHQRPADRYPPTRNLEILEAVVEKARADGGEPDGRTKAYMGTEMMAQGRFPEAVGWLQDYINDPSCQAVGDERSQIFHKLGMCMRTLGQPMACVEAEFAAIRERDDWSENAVGLCEAFAELNEWKRSEVWAKRALELGAPSSILILNPLEFTFVPFVRLAQACMASNRYDEAAQYASQALALQPENEMAKAIAMMIQRDGLKGKAIDALLTLREVCVRFDENWKAHQIMQHAPYIVQDDPRFVSARAMQTENVMHAINPDEYTRWYEDEPKESTVPDEWVENAGDYIERAKFTLEVCQKFEAEHGRKPRVLDLGCNDFWMAGYLWLQGQYVSDGIELNKASVEKAAGRVERFGIPGKIVQGNILDAPRLLAANVVGGEVVVGDNFEWEYDWPKYDVVTCFEVYEHVPETEHLLAIMEALLSPEGIACVTTPNGAFEQGNLAMWHMVERKGHLRAVPALELAGQLSARGVIEDFRIHNGDTLTFAAWKPRKKAGKVILFSPGGWEPWSPASIKDGGVGGSETALSYLAVHLAMRDFDVRVYTDAEPGLYVGSIWRPAGAFDATEEADAIIVPRAPQAFGVDLHAPMRALWCHDHSYPMTPDQIERMTHIVTLSEWERDRFAAKHEGVEDKLVIVRNGVSLRDTDGDPRFTSANRSFGERKPHAIYSSSADRGLDKMLEWWPKIRAEVPDAELHVYYGWEVFDRVARISPHLVNFKAHVMNLAAAAGGEEGGVFFHGRVGQPELYDAMQNARVWSYPSYFLETSCIGAMEARAAGLPIVTSRLGALVETVGEHGILLNPDEPTPDHVVLDDVSYGEPFTKIVSRLLTDEAFWTGWHEKGMRDVESLDWSHRVDDWVRLIESSRIGASARPLVAA